MYVMYNPQTECSVKLTNVTELGNHIKITIPFPYQFGRGSPGSYVDKITFCTF